MDGVADHVGGALLAFGASTHSGKSREGTSCSMKIEWRRGFFRVWAMLALAWIGLAGSIAL
jgi:hypothetical protein